MVTGGFPSQGVMWTVFQMLSHHDPLFYQISSVFLTILIDTSSSLVVNSVWLEALRQKICIVILLMPVWKCCLHYVGHFVLASVCSFLWCWDLNILTELGQYHGCWCPGPLALPGHLQPWYSLYRINRSLSSLSNTICAISVSISDRKCRLISIYIFLRHLKNIWWVKVWHSTQSMAIWVPCFVSSFRIISY